ncbi:MAG: arsenate reductase [Betaproteobacteria bacterium]|nr:MAG: arsenate reductase [Betaproteobacteria bacterium]
MTITLYGIPNCDSVKKARTLLDSRGVAYAFHDYKKLGVPELALRRWVGAKGRDVVLNRKGTTWRALDDAQKASVVDDESAVALMLAHPSVIKRPVVEIAENDATRFVVGLDLDALPTS